VSKTYIFIALLSVLLSLNIQNIKADSEYLIPKHQLENSWYQLGDRRIQWKKNFLTHRKTGIAKNIILFLGDGMGVSTVTAARIHEGQLNGMLGEENNLSFDAFPFTALMKTYNVDAQTPDSAGTMTAIMTGVKTNAGVIGVDEKARKGNCLSIKGHELITALELAELKGKSTGIVTTTSITHATPAATYAKTPDRYWENISDMPTHAITQGCEDIASQLIYFEDRLKAKFPQSDQINGIEVAMGGGRKHFLPTEANTNHLDATATVEGERTDGRNLIRQWQDKYPNGEYVFDQSGFDSIDPLKTKKLLALFNQGHMQYEVHRHQNKAGEPSLKEMTTKAISILSQNTQGYFLMVESGRIDHAHHAGSAHNALHDTIAFSDAIQAATQSVDLTDTLILVTADHSHVFTLSGYPKRGNPILGKVVSVGSDKPALAKDGLPYTTLGYANGRGFQYLGNETNADASYDLAINAGRKNLSQIDTTAPGYHQEALVPLSSETHGGEDVVLYGLGQGADYVMGTEEQNIVFHIMNQAAQLNK